MARDLEKIMSLSGPGLDAGSAGFHLRPPDEEWLFAILTEQDATSGAYSWTEVMPAGEGTWDVLEDGRQGTATSLPAYEASGLTVSLPHYTVLYVGVEEMIFYGSDSLGCWAELTDHDYATDRYAWREVVPATGGGWTVKSGGLYGNLVSNYAFNGAGEHAVPVPGTYVFMVPGYSSDGTPANQEYIFFHGNITQIIRIDSSAPTAGLYSATLMWARDDGVTLDASAAIYAKDLANASSLTVNSYYLARMTGEHADTKKVYTFRSSNITTTPVTSYFYRSDCVNGIVYRYKQEVSASGSGLVFGSWQFDSYQGCCDCSGSGYPPASGSTAAAGFGPPVATNCSPNTICRVLRVRITPDGSYCTGPTTTVTVNATFGGAVGLEGWYFSYDAGTWSVSGRLCCDNTQNGWRFHGGIFCALPVVFTCGSEYSNQTLTTVDDDPFQAVIQLYGGALTLDFTEHPACYGDGPGDGGDGGGGGGGSGGSGGVIFGDTRCCPGDDCSGGVCPISENLVATLIASGAYACFDGLEIPITNSPGYLIWQGSQNSPDACGAGGFEVLLSCDDDESASTGKSWTVELRYVYGSGLSIPAVTGGVSDSCDPFDLTMVLDTGLSVHITEVA